MVATQDTSAPLIVVFGATGTQGGSVIDHLISSSKSYRIRAVTRDPSKPSGKKLEEKGCEVVKAEMGEKEEVEEAVKGSEVVFVSTLRLLFKPGTLIISYRASQTSGTSPLPPLPSSH